MSNNDLIKDVPDELKPIVTDIINKAASGLIDEARRQFRRLVGKVSGDEEAYLIRIGEMTQTDRDNEWDNKISEGKAMATTNKQRIVGQRELAEDAIDQIFAILITKATAAGILLAKAEDENSSAESSSEDTPTPV